MGKEHFKIISEFVSDCLIVRDDISQDERVKIIEALHQCQKEVDSKGELIEDLRDVVHDFKTSIRVNSIIMAKSEEFSIEQLHETIGESNAYSDAVNRILEAVKSQCVKDTND